LRAELVVAALKMTLAHGRKISDEVLRVAESLLPIWLHSDRGVQFASSEFRETLTLAGIAQSMSGRGDCRDNAPCESRFGKLKSEWIYPHGVYATRKEAELAIVDYVEMIYNGELVHQALGYQTPNEFEKKYVDERWELTNTMK